MMIISISFGLTACKNVIKRSTVSTEAIDDSIKYTLSFETNGGTPIGTMSLKKDEAIVIGTTTREGYEFEGWYIDSSFATKFNSNKMPGRDITLYAKWKELKYTISFETYSRDKINPIQFDEGAEIVLPANPTLTGYDFGGWYLDEDCTKPFEMTIMPKKDIKLYARWNFAVKTITFVTNSEDSAVNQLLAVPGSEIELEIPYRAKYSFLGWFRDEGLRNEFTDTIMPSENITLYAKWEKMDFEMVLHDEYHETIKEMIQYEQLFYLPEVTFEHAVLEGWYYDSKFKNKVENNYILVSDNTEFYVKWTLNVYTLNYVTEYDECKIDPVNHTFKEEVKLPELGNKRFAFDGFYYDSAYSRKIEEGFKAPNENLTLYAKFTPIYHTIFLNSEGFENIVCQYGDTKTLPIIEDKYDQTFEGWFNGEEGPVERITMGEEDIQLNPTFKDIMCTLEFVSNFEGFDDEALKIVYKKGTEITNEVLRDSSKYPLHAELSGRGGEVIRFAGWYTDESLDDEYLFNGTRDDSYTLYARWQSLTKSSYELIYFDLEKEAYTCELNDVENFKINGFLGDKIRLGIHANPTCDYMTFLGYYEASIVDGKLVYGEEVDLVYEATSKLIAEKWEFHKFTLNIKYDLGVNSESSIQTDTHNDITYLDKITIDKVHSNGYMIKGFYLDEALTEPFKHDTRMTHYDLTLYADIEDISRTINFTGTEIGFDETNEYLYKSDIVLSTLSSNDDFEFKGWKIIGDPDCDENIILPAGATYKVNKNVTITAVFRSLNFVVVFDTNIPDDVLIMNDSLKNLSASYSFGCKLKDKFSIGGAMLGGIGEDLDLFNNFANYTFEGLYTSKTFEDETAVTDEDIIVDNMTIYIKWESREACTITFMNGYYTYKVINIYKGGKFIAPTCESSNELMELDCWAGTIVGSVGTSMCFPGNEIEAKYSVVYKAVFRETMAKITFVLNVPDNALLVDISRYVDDEYVYKFKKENNPTFKSLYDSAEGGYMDAILDNYANYAVEGWYTSPTFEPYTKVSDTTRFSSGTKVYAKWQYCEYVSVYVYVKNEGREYYVYNLFAKIGQLIVIPGKYNNYVYDYDNMDAPNSFVPQDVARYIRVSEFYAESYMHDKSYYTTY